MGSGIEPARPTVDYSRANEEVVLHQAVLLVGYSLRDLHGTPASLPGGKGSFGQLLELLHFGYSPNSESVADFPEARLELKSTGVIPNATGMWRAKERLVLNVINYHSLVEEESYRDSMFFKKNGRLLLVIYAWRADLSPLDFQVQAVDVISLGELNESDRAIIEADWRTIRRVVQEGRAHELSEGDTLYLAACRKGAGRGRDSRTQPFSDEPAPQRAFSLKPGFVTRLVEKVLASAPERSDEQAAVDNPAQLLESTFEQLMLARFEVFRGLTAHQIATRIAPDLNTRAKGFHASLVSRMLGVRTKKIEELEKADVTLKVVRIGKRGRPKESMSFPAFKYRELAKETWRTSNLRGRLSKRFLMAFFAEDGNGYKFSHATFWSMPETVLEREVRRVWIETVVRIRRGCSHDLPGISFSEVLHVRPHARNAADTDRTPDGRELVRKSFWLNASYIGRIYRGET